MSIFEKLYRFIVDTFSFIGGTLLAIFVVASIVAIGFLVNILGLLLIPVYFVGIIAYIIIMEMRD